MAVINHEAELARAGANVSSTWGQMGFLARRYPLGAVGFSIVFLFVEAPRSIEIEARQLLLIALIPRGQRRFDLTRVRELHITFEALEAFRNGIESRPLRVHIPPTLLYQSAMPLLRDGSVVCCQ